MPRIPSQCAVRLRAQAEKLRGISGPDRDNRSPCSRYLSLAITDSAPQLDDGSYREMKICPLFFTAANTKNNLDSKKYDGDKRGSWCQKGQHFKDFETAGHTLLHEMTHLDALAKAAGLPEQWVAQQILHRQSLLTIV